MSAPFLTEFNQMKAVLCICPECNNISRLSDLHLRSKSKAPLTWLDTYEEKLQRADQKEMEFKEEESNIRKEAKEHGRAQVPELVRKTMDPKMMKLEYDPYDIKAVFHPIDFAIFDGMNKNEMKNVVLLSKFTKNVQLDSLHKEIAKAIENKAYDWKVARVTQDGEVNYE